MPDGGLADQNPETLAGSSWRDKVKKLRELGGAATQKSRELAAQARIRKDQIAAAAGQKAEEAKTRGAAFGSDLEQEIDAMVNSFKTDVVDAGINRATPFVSDTARQVREIHQDVKSGAIRRGVKQAWQSTKDAFVTDPGVRNTVKTADVYIPSSEMMQGIDRTVQIHDLIGQNFQLGVWEATVQNANNNPDFPDSVNWWYEENRLTHKRVYVIDSIGHEISASERINQIRNFVRDGIESRQVSREDAQMVIDAEVAVLAQMEQGNLSNEQIEEQASNIVRLLNVWGGQLGWIDTRGMDPREMARSPLAQAYKDQEKNIMADREKIAQLLAEHPILRQVAMNQLIEMTGGYKYREAVFDFNRNNKNMVFVVEMTNVLLGAINETVESVNGDVEALTPAQRAGARERLAYLKQISRMDGLTAAQRERLNHFLNDYLFEEPRRKPTPKPDVIPAPKSPDDLERNTQFIEAVQQANKVLTQFRALPDQWVGANEVERPEILEKFREEMGLGKGNVDINRLEIVWALKQLREALSSIYAFRLCFKNDPRLQGLVDNKDIFPFANDEIFRLELFYRIFTKDKDGREIEKPKLHTVES